MRQDVRPRHRQSISDRPGLRSGLEQAQHRRTQTELPAENTDIGFANAGNRRASIEPPTIPSLDLMFPPTTPGPRMRPKPPPTVTGIGAYPQYRPEPAAATFAGAYGHPHTGSGRHRSRKPCRDRPWSAASAGWPTAICHGLNSNTDQATVPLIDFDLTGADAALTGRRTPKPKPRSPHGLTADGDASSIWRAGYIDLGVKDGARELLEEVMKDGTREQRQQAVELRSSSSKPGDRGLNPGGARRRPPTLIVRIAPGAGV